MLNGIRSCKSLPPRKPSITPDLLNKSLYFKSFSTTDNLQKKSNIEIINFVEKKKPFFKDFHNLDDIAIDTAEFLINSMQIMMKLPSIQKIKYDAINAMLNAMTKNQINKKIILEVGCGHGADAKLIAQLISDSEKVIAVDSSTRMIKIAKQMSAHPNIEYLAIDVNHLSQKGYKKYFNGCHADRLLVSCSDYKKLFQNILELMQVNSTLAFTDVEPRSIGIHPFDETTKIILDELLQGFVNKSLGGNLPELFIENGLKNIQVIPAISEVRDFEIFCKIFQIKETIKSAVQSGKLSKKSGDTWFEKMILASKEGKFLYFVTFITVIGVVS